MLLADGRLLVAGNLDGPYSLDYTAELYDPATDTWSLGPALDIPLTYRVAARLHDGRVLMAGGQLGSVFYPSPLVHLTPRREKDLGVLGALAVRLSALSSGFNPVVVPERLRPRACSVTRRGTRRSHGVTDSGS
ncbi:hypothetical protein [Sorangium sp. So ce513]|uniref:hypothetical protein n=1 Tax=Sorangium sp. So ce513 TaxID=3133315 RepID=UPI003F5FDC3D